MTRERLPTMLPEIGTPTSSSNKFGHVVTPLGRPMAIFYSALKRIRTHYLVQLQHQPSEREHDVASPVTLPSCKIQPQYKILSRLNKVHITPAYYSAHAVSLFIFSPTVKCYGVEGATTN
jgi:hypothetical protein